MRIQRYQWNLYFNSVFLLGSIKHRHSWYVCNIYCFVPYCMAKTNNGSRDLISYRRLCHWGRPKITAIQFSSLKMVITKKALKKIVQQVNGIDLFVKGNSNIYFSVGSALSQSRWGVMHKVHNRGWGVSRDPQKWLRPLDNVDSDIFMVNLRY